LEKGDPVLAAVAAEGDALKSKSTVVRRFKSVNSIRASWALHSSKLESSCREWLVAEVASEAEDPVLTALAVAMEDEDALTSKCAVALPVVPRFFAIFFIATALLYLW
jgi:hypothetical protein